MTHRRAERMNDDGRAPARRAGVAACAASVLLAAATLGGMEAAAQKAETTAVLQTALQGVEDTEANIIVFEVEPGWETERHIHPGHVFVYVTDGTIEVDVDGEDLRRVSAGGAFYELPDKPMVARTASADEGARFVVFQIGPTGEPIMVPHPH